jgi:4-amino-4-deoxy-L-arabinose transferase-like glycosyltransferase
MLLGGWAALVLAHYRLLCLPYFWDEAGYYALAAVDFYRQHLLIPHSTWSLGHTPLGAVYVGTAWRLFGLSPCVARVAMLLIAAATVVATYELGSRVFRRPSGREMAAWAALLLAVSPLFFAQSAMLHIDLPAALFITLAIIALLERRMALFALAGSLAVLSKETSAIFLPVAWIYAWRQRRELRAIDWAGLLSPLLVALAWTVYNHHHTGFWTGNAQYLKYNIYSTLNPIRFLLSLARRLYQLLLGGFGWVLTVGAFLGLRRQRRREIGTPIPGEAPPLDASAAKLRDLLFLGAGLCTSYLLFHSIVGGALLRRYLLPAFPVFYLGAVWCLWELPRRLARGFSAAAAVLFVAGWFLTGFYSFEFESNLAYADFVRLHQEAAHYLEQRGEDARILTTWPATGELTQPFLGYVTRPLRVIPIEDFGKTSFIEVRPESFDLLYLYSRKSESLRKGVMQIPLVRQLNRRYFDYVPQISDDVLIDHFHLRLMKAFERHGQWVRIYSN